MFFLISFTSFLVRACQEYRWTTSSQQCGTKSAKYCAVDACPRFNQNTSDTAVSFQGVQTNIAWTAESCLLPQSEKGTFANKLALWLTIIAVPYRHLFSTFCLWWSQRRAHWCSSPFWIFWFCVATKNAAHWRRGVVRVTLTTLCVVHSKHRGANKYNRHDDAIGRPRSDRTICLCDGIVMGLWLDRINYDTKL